MCWRIRRMRPQPLQERQFQGAACWLFAFLARLRIAQTTGLRLAERIEKRSKCSCRQQRIFHPMKRCGANFPAEICRFCSLALRHFRKSNLAKIQHCTEFDQKCKAIGRLVFLTLQPSASPWLTWAGCAAMGIFLQPWLCQKSCHGWPNLTALPVAETLGPRASSFQRGQDRNVQQ